MLLATVQAPDNSFSLLRLNPSGSFQSPWFISEAVVGFCPSCCPPALLVNTSHSARSVTEALQNEWGLQRRQASSQSCLQIITKKAPEWEQSTWLQYLTQLHLGRIKSFSSKPNLLMCCKGKRPLVLQTQRNHTPLPRESLGDEMWYMSN